MRAHAEMLGVSNDELIVELANMVEVVTAARVQAVEGRAAAYEVSLVELSERCARLELDNGAGRKAVQELEHSLRRAHLAEAALEAARRRVASLEKEVSSLEEEAHSLKGAVGSEGAEAAELMRMHEDEVGGLKIEQRCRPQPMYPSPRFSCGGALWLPRGGAAKHGGIALTRPESPPCAGGSGRRLLRSTHRWRLTKQSCTASPSSRPCACPHSMRRTPAAELRGSKPQGKGRVWRRLKSSWRR